MAHNLPKPTPEEPEALFCLCSDSEGSNHRLWRRDLARLWSGELGHGQVARGHASLLSASRCESHTAALWSCSWGDFAAIRLSLCESHRSSFSTEGITERRYRENKLQRKIIAAASRREKSFALFQVKPPSSTWRNRQNQTGSSSWDCFPRQHCHGEGEDEERGIVRIKNK